MEMPSSQQICQRFYLFLIHYTTKHLTLKIYNCIFYYMDSRVNYATGMNSDLIHQDLVPILFLSSSWPHVGQPIYNGSLLAQLISVTFTFFFTSLWVGINK
jgi:hypothetical protein